MKWRSVPSSEVASLGSMSAKDHLCGEEGECEAHDFEFNNHCGVKVCTVCDHHLGLARCYCGWAADGGDGRQQLVDMGETIDPD